MRIYVNFDKSQSLYIINFDKIANSSNITSISQDPSVPRFHNLRILELYVQFPQNISLTKEYNRKLNQRLNLVSELIPKRKLVYA